MPKTLQMPLTRYLAPADGDGNDLGGEVIDVQDSDSWTPGSPEDRGDLLDDSATGDAAPATAPAAAAPVAAPAPAASAAPASTPAGAAEAAEVEAEDAKQQAAVPYGRFSEVNERRKQAEREADELRTEVERWRAGSTGKGSESGPAQVPVDKAPAAPEFDLDGKEKSYLDALMEGDTSAASVIRREINAAVMAQARRETTELMQAEFAQREQQQATAIAQQLMQAQATALQAAALAVVAKYAYLDTEAGADAMDMIIARRDALVAKGQAPHEALRAAADFIAPRFAPEGAAHTPAKASEKAPPQTDLRESAARTRGAQASVAQAPAAVAGMGNRATGGDALDVNRMDDDQFERLSAAEKSRLRGD